MFGLDLPPLQSMFRASVFVTFFVFLAACERSTPPAAEPAVQYSQDVLNIAKRSGRDPAEVARARALTATELQELVDTFVAESHHQGQAYWRLTPARDLAVPYLIAVFERENIFKPSDSYGLVSPASQALQFLDKGVHPQLKAHLLRLLPTADERALKIIADDLTSFGSDDLLPTIAMLFEHKDASISGGARSGALDALEAGRAGPAFRAYVWDHSVKLLNSPKPPGMYDSIRLLVAMDAEKARTLISTPEIMRPNHPLLEEALNTLNRMKRPGPATFLKELLANPLPSLPEYRRNRTLQAALRGLVIQKDPSAVEYVEGILSTPTGYHQDMVLTAWDLRFELRGLTPILQAASDAYQKAEFNLEQLTPDHRDMMILSELDSEVYNGGFSQWYSNGGGVNAEAAKKALERISAHQHAKLVHEANSLFGWWGPPNSREKLEAALDSMPERKLEKMDAVAEAWLDLPAWQLSAAAWDWQRQTAAKSQP